MWSSDSKLLSSFQIQIGQTGGNALNDLEKPPNAVNFHCSESRNPRYERAIFYLDKMDLNCAPEYFLWIAHTCMSWKKCGMWVHLPTWKVNPEMEPKLKPEESRLTHSSVQSSEEDIAQGSTCFASSSTGKCQPWALGNLEQVLLPLHPLEIFSSAVYACTSTATSAYRYECFIQI